MHKSKTVLTSYNHLHLTQYILSISDDNVTAWHTEVMSKKSGCMGMLFQSGGYR